MTRCSRPAFWPGFILSITAAVGCTSDRVAQFTGGFRLQPAQEVRSRLEKGRELYPDPKQRIREFFLPVGDGHHYQNHTDAVVEDFEKVRTALKVERWIIMGGSWGSTLALLYAEWQPARVRGLILRGIYLARPRHRDHGQLHAQ